MLDQLKDLYTLNQQQFLEVLSCKEELAYSKSNSLKRRSFKLLTFHT